MDNLSYSYNGNRLNNVSDAVSGDNIVDFVPRGGGSYTYWNDGSLKSDANKEITLINYDGYLGKPIEIQLTGGRWIKMYYAGSGSLLKREFSTGEVWDFGDGIIYKNGRGGQPQPYQMNTPEGRAIYQNGVWHNEFSYTDHLGNALVSFRANGSQLEKVDETAFDPTGIVLNGLGQENSFENRFKHQGKESMTLFGLSGINDFGARYLDKTTGGRWWGVDPLAEIARRFSPYVYANNNPLQFVDLDGMTAREIQDFDGNWHTIGDDDLTTIYQSSDDDDGDDEKKKKRAKNYTCDCPKEPIVPVQIDYLYIISADTRSQDDPTRFVEGLFTIFSPFKALEGLFLFAKLNPLAKAKAAEHLANQTVKGLLQLSKKTFGHTFTTHGEDMTNFLLSRAEGSGMAQGQFLNNQKAAQFILDNVEKMANGAVNIPIPSGFPARVIMPNGSFKAATHIRLVPGGGGVKTAYPLIP